MSPAGSPFQQQAVEIRPDGSNQNSPRKHKGGAPNKPVFRKNSDSREVHKTPTTLWPPPPVRGRSITKASLAAFIFILAALALTSLCMRLRTKALVAGLSQRRLAGSEEAAGSDDEKLKGILEQCLDMKQDYPVTSGTGMPPSASPSTLPTFQPAVNLNGETASVAGPVHGASQAAPSRVSRPAAEDEDFAPPVASGDLSSSAFVASGSSSQLRPLLSPEAWLESIPHILTEYEMRRPHGGAVEGKESSEADKQPSTSGAAREELAVKSATSTDQQQIHLHPFVRLPAVRPGISVTPIDPQDILTCPGAPRLSTGLLGLMRGLFAKPELDASDARALILTAGYLVKFVQRRLTLELTNPHNAHVIRHVGLFFMVADAVVAAYHAVGFQPASFSWWSTFTEAFPTSHQVRSPSKYSRKSTHFNFKLLKGLIGALNIYKTGSRPPVQTVLQLKRMLLCSTYSLAYFKARRWNPWREDNKSFQTSLVESSDESTDEDEAS
ncbi:hypothetical protein Emag_007646 [Eimeria magna]